MGPVGASCRRAWSIKVGGREQLLCQEGRTGVEFRSRQAKEEAYVIDHANPKG